MDKSLLIPPLQVRRAFKKGLELYELGKREGFSGKGLEDATIREARAIAKGTAISLNKLDKGYRFFQRNARFAKFPEKSPAGVAWWLWGGRAGKTWFERLNNQYKKEDSLNSTQEALNSTQEALNSTQEALPMMQTQSTSKSLSGRIDSFLEHYDRSKRGNGKPCGRGWISADKKCSKKKSQQFAADLKAGDPFAIARKRRGQELAEERQRLRRETEGRPERKKIVSDRKGLEISDEIARQARNEVVRSRISDRRNMLSQIKGFDRDSKKLAEEFKSYADMLKGIEELQKILKDAEPVMKKIRKKEIASLERSLSGKLQRSEARMADLFRKNFEVLNPRKQIKMPKGSTQADFLEAVMNITSGDREAIAKFVRPRPRPKRPPRRKK